MNSVKRESQFAAGEGVVSWQSVKSGGNLYLLGRKPTSVTLLVYNGSAHFSQHSLGNYCYTFLPVNDCISSSGGLPIRHDRQLPKGRRSKGAAETAV